MQLQPRTGPAALPQHFSPIALDGKSSRMMVIVHSVSWRCCCSQLQLPSSRPNGQQPIETSQLKPSSGARFTARLKSCPDTKHEFFRSLFSRAVVKPQLRTLESAISLPHADSEAVD